MFRRGSPSDAYMFELSDKAPGFNTNRVRVRNFDTSAGGLHEQAEEGQRHEKG